MECLYRYKDRYQQAVDTKDDKRLLWIIEQHGKDDWLAEYRPETNPRLRLYMRLVKQEAYRRGLLRT
jgi:hypothetical protein